jgi:hypothetical protein
VGLRSRRRGDGVTALQIASGENWQNIAEGSIMYRMFRGWNERRQVIGKPMLSYQNAAFVPVDNIADARIYVGANLQNAEFWRTLETEDFVPVLQTNFDSTNYVIALGTIEGDDVLTVYDSYAGGVDARYGVSITPTQQGDILAMEKINAILRRMYAYRQAHIRFGRHKAFRPNQKLEIIGGGTDVDCASDFEGVVNNSPGNLFGVLGRAGVLFDGVGCPPKGCISGSQQYAIINYTWPSNLVSNNSKYVWWSLNIFVFFNLPQQFSTTFQYNKTANIKNELGGTFDTRNYQPDFTDEDWWFSNSNINEYFTCGVLRNWEGFTSTNNIITEPKFTDLTET